MNSSIPLLPNRNPKPFLPKALNIRQALLQGSQKLTQALELPFNVARLEAESLLGFILGWKRTKILAHDHELLQVAHWQAFENLLAKRIQGMPLAYLTQEQEFFGLPFKVNEHVLVPRPETEILVEKALQIAKHGTKILDLGTGSGAIALALAKSNPSFAITACDQSIGALEVAQENAKRLKASHVTFLQSNWYENVSEPFDIICSNPPYIEENHSCLCGLGVAFEPKSALVAKGNGLADLRHIIEHAPAYLYGNGALLVEHGHLQQEAVQTFFKKAGFADIETVKDLAGHPRVTLGFMKSS